MYTESQREKAISLYIKYGLKASPVVREPCYPDRHSLKNWYNSFMENNEEIVISHSRKTKYTGTQRKEAVDFYLNHGKSIFFTVKSLGYPCRSRKRVKYIRLPDLLMDLETARIQGTYRKMIKQLGKLDLLILDEFLLTSVNETEVNNILEIMGLRCNKKIDDTLQSLDTRRMVSKARWWTCCRCNIRSYHQQFL